MIRPISLLLVTIFLVGSGCSKPPDNPGGEPSGGDSRRSSPAAPARATYTLAIIRQTIENGERKSDGRDRFDEPGEAEIIRLFKEVDWADSSQSPAFSLSQSTNENLTMRRPDPDVESDQLVAEWRLLDQHGNYQVLVAGPMAAPEEAAKLLTAFYREEDLQGLAPWEPKED